MMDDDALTDIVASITPEALGMLSDSTSDEAVVAIGVCESIPRVVEEFLILAGREDWAENMNAIRAEYSDEFSVLLPVIWQAGRIYERSLRDE